MSAQYGLSGGLSAPISIFMLIASFTAIAWYNVLELNLMIYFRFKRHRGLYFWSLCISSWGVALHALSFLAKFFQVWKHDIVSVAFICLGWYCMVTGQSLVLYSRLHLVSRKRGRWVLGMIIVDAILLHGITTVLVFGANSSHSAKFLFAYSVMEKIQVTIFAVQETIISSLYIYYTHRLLHPHSLFPHASTRKVMNHLLRVNILIIIMDLTLLGTEFANHYEIQTTYKSALYSIKLKLEFVILNQLVELTKGNLRRRGLGESNTGLNPNARRQDGGAREWPRNRCMGGGQGVEPSTQTYFVSASSEATMSGGRQGSLRAAREVREGGVLKTIDVEVTVEKEEEGCASNPNFGMGRWDIHSEKTVRIGSGSSSSTWETGSARWDIEKGIVKPEVSLVSGSSHRSEEMGFVTGSAFLEDIIEVPTPTSPCEGGGGRVRQFP